MASKITNLGGYDCDFVEAPPDELLCLICTVVAREPMQMNCCGRVYCKACLTELRRRSNVCPNCRNVGKGYPDIRGERNIKALKVKCNLNNGCLWVGELALLQEHHDTCDSTLVPCPNKCKNGANFVQVLRKNLEFHCNYKCPNRSYQCPRCRKEGKYCDITTSHLETCPQLLVPCPNQGCKEELPESVIPDHRTKCPFEKVGCKYSKIGCKYKPLRKAVAVHENNDKLHLHIAMETILKREHDSDQMQTRLNKLETESKEHASQMQSRFDKVDDKIKQVSPTAGSQFVCKVSEFSQRKSSKKIIYSPPFYSRQGGYKMFLRVDANGQAGGEGTHVSVFAYLMRGENDDTLTWPFTGTLTVELLNQLEDKEHHQKTIAYPEDKDGQHNRRVVDEEMSTGWGRPKFIPHSTLGHRPATNCQYLKDDCLYFRVSVTATPNPKPWLACTV